MFAKLAAALAAVGAVLVTALPPSTASALTVGVPVDALGSMTTVGDFVPGGDINFYIPISEDAVYGDTSGSTGGLSADMCSVDCEGSLTMYVMYDPTSLGANVATMVFDDLDLEGYSDPTGVGFVESIAFYDADLNPIDVTVESADNVTQTLLAMVPNVTSSPFWAQIVFGARIESTFGGWHKTTWTNTEESMYTTIAPVPLPAALPLFGTAVVGLGLVGRWRKRARG